MLRTRVVTACILLAGFLSALFWLPDAAWAALALILATGAAWEWAGLVGRSGHRRAAYAAAVGAATAAVWLADRLLAWSGALLLFGASLLFWCVAVPLWLARKWPLAAGGGPWIGFLMIVPTALALIMLRHVSPAYLLTAMAIVWVADIAAYFSGRTFGTHKLAPLVSPGKTWEGAIGGAAAVLAYGFAVLEATGHPLRGEAAGSFALILLALTILSVVGDLFESLAKRQAGLKDSGSLLPGHGGLLDRIDSLTATLPAIALISVSPYLRATFGL